MSMTIIDRYKGYRIDYSEERNLFKALTPSDNEVFCSFSELKKVKEYIDRSKKKKFERFDIYTTRGYNEDRLRKVTVTSINQEGNLFIKNLSGSREKLYRSDSCYEITSENTKIVAAIDILTKEKDIVEGKIEDLMKKLKKIKNTKPEEED